MRAVGTRTWPSAAPTSVRPRMWERLIVGGAPYREVMKAAVAYEARSAEVTAQSGLLSSCLDERTDLTTSVPSHPDGNLVQLLRRLGRVHRWWRRSSGPGRPSPARHRSSRPSARQHGVSACVPARLIESNPTARRHAPYSWPRCQDPDPAPPWVSAFFALLRMAHGPRDGRFSAPTRRRHSAGTSPPPSGSPAMLSPSGWNWTHCPRCSTTIPTGANSSAPAAPCTPCTSTPRTPRRRPPPTGPSTPPATPWPGSVRRNLLSRSTRPHGPVAPHLRPSPRRQRHLRGRG